MWRVLLALMAVDGGVAPTVNLHRAGSELTVTWRGQEQVLHFDQAPPDAAPVAHSLLLAAIDHAKVEVVVEKGALAWVVLDVSGPSRPLESAGKFCGAGVEHAKVLVRFGARPAQPDVVLVDSCFATIEARPVKGALTGLHFFRQVPEADGGARLDDVTLRLDFDARRPERGFQLTTLAAERAP